MKKRKLARMILCAVTATILMWASVLCVSAQKPELKQKLSPAFDVIGARQRMVKSGLVFENVRFTLTDFKQCLGVSELESITVREIPEPSAGFLAVGSMVVSKGQQIYGSMLSMLEFVPASASVEIASFSFSGDENTSGAEIRCSVRLIDRVNYAPTVALVHENRLSLTALSGKSTRGTLLATDPEGDNVRYEIVKYADHGIISDFDEDSGAFVYTSYDGYSGSDGFEYVAADEYGNYTRSVSVSINVEKDKDGITFGDMEGSGDLSAASVMVSKHIMDCSVRGGERLFLPDIKVSRADFIVMAMKAAGKKPSEDTRPLDGIADVSGLSTEARGYISAAIENGYVTPEQKNGQGKLLRPSDIITKAEAASIISKLCGYQKKADDISVFADFYNVEAEHRQCLSAMYEYGIVDFSDGMIFPDALLTREACARMLYRYMNI